MTNFETIQAVKKKPWFGTLKTLSLLDPQGVPFAFLTMPALKLTLDWVLEPSDAQVFAQTGSIKLTPGFYVLSDFAVCGIDEINLQNFDMIIAVPKRLITPPAKLELYFDREVGLPNRWVPTFFGSQVDYVLYFSGPSNFIPIIRS